MTTADTRCTLYIDGVKGPTYRHPAIGVGNMRRRFAAAPAGTDFVLVMTATNELVEACGRYTSADFGAELERVVDTTPKTDAARWFDSQSFGDSASMRLKDSRSWRETA